MQGVDYLEIDPLLAGDFRSIDINFRLIHADIVGEIFNADEVCGREGLRLESPESIFKRGNGDVVSPHPLTSPQSLPFHFGQRSFRIGSFLIFWGPLVTQSNEELESNPGALPLPTATPKSPCTLRGRQFQQYLGNFGVCRRFEKFSPQFLKSLRIFYKKIIVQFLDFKISKVVNILKPQKDLEVLNP